MTHSKNYEKVYNYYKQNLWNLEQATHVVAKNWITKKEFQEITGMIFSNKEE